MFLKKLILKMICCLTIPLTSEEKTLRQGMLQRYTHFTSNFISFGMFYYYYHQHHRHNHHHHWGTSLYVTRSVWKVRGQLSSNPSVLLQILIFSYTCNIFLEKNEKFLFVLLFF